ncbi:hypothetical protein N7462_004725 [Penicillium macrosclerotiorum]|uniref:uncharacterized protein n=1 Tax=Penicillium macrosclerotiorum TaxID=303699 RepID=UPI002548437E|nr:uncharacterized protein N7462_004725 [Penicillium macrosclerotiorum]KAJ5690333.1 hypothetical protein N7462_004725 [Penicillium macrosclerotiorum]
MEPNYSTLPTTISGDLPIRTLKPLSGHELPQEALEAKNPPKKVEFEEPEPHAKPKVGAIIHSKFEDELGKKAGQLLAGRKVKHRRPKSQRGIGKPTGFEEYSADGPLTPKEWEEDREIYSPRIEEALARYQWKRRIEPDRRNILFKYLQYGGIVASQNYGAGVPPKELKQMPVEEARQARSQTTIPLDRSKLQVSFNEVVRGFLTFFIPYFHPDTEDAIKIGTITIRNFYTYILFHEVCPEYTDDLLKARKTCDLATTELWKNVRLVREGPGGFNKCCSVLFGGYYSGSIGLSYKNPECREQEDATPALTFDIARKVVKFAIAGAGSNEQAFRFQELANDNKVSALKIEDIDGFEITAVVEPDSATCSFYESYASDLTTVGKIRAKSFIDPAKPAIDMCAEERQAWNTGKAPQYGFEFIIEQNLLPYFYPGLKILSSVWELNCGIYYFDQIYSTYPAFHTVLANEMMLGWKTPREVEVETNHQGPVLPGVHEAVRGALKATGQKKEAEKVGKEGIEH